MSTPVSTPVRRRNSALEALRILAMLMIILSHSCVHSGYSVYEMPLSINRLFLQFGTTGNLSVVLFVMISGYFLWEKPFRLTSISQLLAQVWFYSLAVALGCAVVFRYPFSLHQLHAIFMPTIFDEYWFFTAYIILLLLSPYINVLIASLSRSALRNLLLCMTVLWVLIPSLTQQWMYSTELPQFLLFYMLGAYLGKFPDNRLFAKKHRYLLAAGSLLCLLLLVILLGLLEPYYPKALQTALQLYNRNSLLILGLALGLFAIAVRSKPFYSPLINAVGSCTFGIYLIHDNPAARQILWTRIFWQGDYLYTPSFIPRILLSVGLVFLICTCIEFVRLKTIAVPMTRLIDALLHRLAAKLPIQHK